MYILYIVYAYITALTDESVAATEHHLDSDSGEDRRADSGGSMAAIDPPKRTRKIFLNISENKSSDRKLSLIPFVSSAFYVE